MLWSGFLLLYANFAISVAMYTEMDSVVELSPMNFKQQVLEKQKLVVVEFYASWCGHCLTFAPEWMEVAKKLKGIVTVAAIKCDDDKNQALCTEYNVRRYPTIKTFKPEINEEGAIVKSTSDYLGPRDSKPLVRHLLSSLPSNVRSIKADVRKVNSKSNISLDDFLGLDNGTVAKVILFSDKPKTMTSYSALSLDFGDRQLLMGEVKKSEKKVVDVFGVATFPTLLVLIPGKGERSLIYDGKLNYKSLYKYLSNIASASIATADDDALKMETSDRLKHFVKHNVGYLESRAHSDSLGDSGYLQTFSDYVVMIDNSGAGGVADLQGLEQLDHDRLDRKPVSRDEL